MDWPRTSIITTRPADKERGCWREPSHGEALVCSQDQCPLGQRSLFPTVVPGLEITCTVSHSHLVIIFFFLEDNVCLQKGKKERVKFNSLPTVEKQLNLPASPLQPVANSFLQVQARGREWERDIQLRASYKGMSSGTSEECLHVTGEPVYKFK